jgi:hypothetical protein
MKSKTIFWLLLIVVGAFRLEAQNLPADAAKQFTDAWNKDPVDCLATLRLLITYSDASGAKPKSREDVDKTVRLKLKKAGVTPDDIVDAGLTNHTLANWLLTSYAQDGAKDPKFKDNATAVVNKIYGPHLSALNNVYDQYIHHRDEDLSRSLLYLLEALPSSDASYSADLATLRAAYAPKDQSWTVFDLVVAAIEGPQKQ